MKKSDIVVIGGGPAGVVVAVTARKYYPDKSIVMITGEAKSPIPCGIPYMFNTLSECSQNIMSTTPLVKSGVDIVVDKVIKIDRGKKNVVTEKGDTYSYDKLVLATGSLPIIPPIPGFDLEGVYSVHKNMAYLEKVVKDTKNARRVLILGGGFIGVEFADEISNNKNTEVFLVEILPHILARSFDPEFSVLAEEKLRAKGVKVLTNTKVEKFAGDRRIRQVHLSNGQDIEVDAVVSGVGSIPNTKLARDAGLELGKGKGIWVDEYMRTADRDVFAVGDCAGKRDFFTRRDAPVMLASTATAEARVAGANLYQLKVIRENKGTIAGFSTYVDGLVLGSAGLTEITAHEEGFEVTTGVSEGVDKHPGAMPRASKNKVKLVFSTQSGIILGGQVAGGQSCGELINTIGVCIQKRVSITELETLQMATHPWLTSAPTMYPLVQAALNAI